MFCNQILMSYNVGALMSWSWQHLNVPAKKVSIFIHLCIQYPRYPVAVVVTILIYVYTIVHLLQGSYLTAYNTASETARRRYDNKHRGVIFHTDMLVQSDLAWELSQLVVDVQQHELHVTAISYLTPNSEQFGERAGLYYCKILPPDRALQWIYVDSLRRDMPS